jgi:hypothetical protein
MGGSADIVQHTDRGTGQLVSMRLESSGTQNDGANLSTMFLIVNLFIALSLGVQREQLEHLIGLTWPRPFLFRPLKPMH